MTSIVVSTWCTYFLLFSFFFFAKIIRAQSSICISVAQCTYNIHIYIHTCVMCTSEFLLKSLNSTSKTSTHVQSEKFKIIATWNMFQSYLNILYYHFVDVFACVVVATCNEKITKRWNYCTNTKWNVKWMKRRFFILLRYICFSIHFLAFLIFLTNKKKKIKKEYIFDANPLSINCFNKLIQATHQRHTNIINCSSDRG